MSSNYDSKAQYPDLQAGNGVQTQANGSTLRENVTNCKVGASKQAVTQPAMEAASRIRTSEGKRVPGRLAVTATCLHSLIAIYLERQ
jgi:hypothetical protein